MLFYSPFIATTNPDITGAKALPPRLDVRVTFDADATVPQVMSVCSAGLTGTPASIATTTATAALPRDFLLLVIMDDGDTKALDEAIEAELHESNVAADAVAFTVQTHRGKRDGASMTCVRVHRRADVDADSPLFDLDRTRGHLDVALASLPAAIKSEIGSHALPLITPAELQQQHAWNKACVRPALLSRAVTLPGIILAAARRNPDAEAVSLESGEVWSYRRLVTRARSIATRLITLVDPKVDPADGLKGRTIGVYLSRGPELLASLLAVQMTRAAYLPLDPLYPAERVGNMVLDADASAVLTSAAGNLVRKVGEAMQQATPRDKIEGKHPLANLPIFLVDSSSDDEHDHGVDDMWEICAGEPDDQAYVIFTSGSTGRPKGVMVSQHNIVNFMGSMIEITGANAQTRLCAVTTVCFDIAGLELFLPAWAGGRLVIASEDTAKDPDALDALLRRENVNMMQATPTTWRMLLGVSNGDAPEDKHRLNLTALVGGEALPMELAGEMLTKLGVTYNVYGPTETTVWSTAARVSLPNLTSIGTPIANTRVYVMAVSDPASGKGGPFMTPAPVGVAGELCIAGAGVSMGYQGREDLTNERFPLDPFPRNSGDRMYRTGDLARYRADGTLQCLGRLDHQVKIRGYRVELGEIETALAVLPEIDQAVVMARPATIAGGAESADAMMQLVAYVIESDLPNLSEDAGKITKAESKTVEEDLAEAAAWGAVYDEAYAARDALDETDPSLNFSGYGNSYTPGKVHQVPPVREWVETICDRIAKLNPKRALELGCGNGMILLRIAKLCERYVGTDLSVNAIDFVRDIVTKHPNFLLPQCGLDTAGAHEAMRFAKEKLDTVICNGVSMYFPSADYLYNVCAESLGAVAAGGHFFLGDVRNACLLAHFNYSVQTFIAEPETSFAALRVTAATAVKQEKEFLVDPAAFLAMARSQLVANGLCDRMVIDMRRGWHRTEFAMYRYDVTFRRAKMGNSLGCDGGEGARYELTAWDESKDTLASVEARIVAEKPDYVAFTGALDARLVYERILMQEFKHPSKSHGTAGKLRDFVAAAAAAAEKTALEPEAVYQLGEKLGYTVNAMWSPVEPTRFDFVLAREGAPEPEPIVYASLRSHGMSVKTPTSNDKEAVMEMLRELTNKGEAMTARAEADVEEATALGAAVSTTEPEAWEIMAGAKARALRTTLRSRLPPYMVPAAIVRAVPGGPGMPMTANGKVDRASLPHPASLRKLNHGADDASAERSAAYVPPEGEAEEAIAALFEDILSPQGSLQVGACDDFFELGGHSLLAMQLIGQLDAKVGVRLKMGHLADAPNPRALAKVIEKMIASSPKSNQGSGDISPTSPFDPRGSVNSLVSSSPAPELTVVDPSLLPHGPVTRVDSISFKARDGCELVARLWLPANCGDAFKVPAVVEVLPYGFQYGTVDVDEATWPYLAGHGVACVRVDARGSGASNGDLDDEYSPMQQFDACDAVEWAASQAWCTGSVGLMGCSWGGFIALQAAALAGAAASKEAPSLKAVCAVCATDDRASDDMHYMGGALLGENLAWGSWLLETLAVPPVETESSELTAEEWERKWVARLEALSPLHSEWAGKHPFRGTAAAYWNEGSIGRVGGTVGGGLAGKIEVPVLSVGGFAGGGYSNSTPRLARRLGANQVMAVMGGWVHNYPHISSAGPAYGFLADALAFWKTHLCDNAPGAMTSGVKVHVQQPPLLGPPVTVAERAEGYWVGKPSQRELDDAVEGGALVFDFTPDGKLAKASKNAAIAAPVLFAQGAKVQLTDSHVNPVGVASGRWFTFGDGDDLPGDQRPDDLKSACFDAFPAASETTIIGAPRVSLSLDAAVHAEGHVVARVCAVAPDGMSHRVTYGVADVQSHRKGQRVDVECNYCAFSLPVGWHLRVAVSQTYWPVLAPNPRGCADIAIVGGAVTVPVLPDAAAAMAMVPRLEVVATPRANFVRRARGVKNDVAPRRVVRAVDLGARSFEGGFVVEGSSVERSELIDASQHVQAIERRSVVKGSVCTHKEVAGETDLRAEMHVCNGEYKFITTLEAYVHDEGDTARRRSVFSQRWMDIVPAPRD